LNPSAQRCTPAICSSTCCVGVQRDAQTRSRLKGYETHLESISGFLYVGTWTYGSTTSVIVELHDSKPTLAEADHVVEVTLDGGGELAIRNWDPDDPPVAQVGLPSGRMALRGSWTGLQAVEEFPERGVAGDTDSPEVIRFQIWPSPDCSAKVLKGVAPGRLLTVSLTFHSAAPVE
jgi:hypothetical protein